MEMTELEDRWLEEANDEPSSSGGKLFSAIVTNVLLFFLIFGLSATVEITHLKSQLHNKWAIITGVAMQFLIMPALGFFAVLMLRDAEFTEPMAITLLVVTASPGGSFSNWWCSLFNADLALSVAMTAVSSLLSVGLLPANLFLYSYLAFVVVPGDEGKDINIFDALDFKAIYIALGVVMGGVLLGLFAGYTHGSAKFHKRANQFGSFCGLLLIFFSMFLGSGGGGGNTNFWSLPWSFYVGVAFPCLVGMLLANIISRFFELSPPETVAISIECCYQNTAIAISVAASMFSDPTARTEAISVPLFYGFVEAILIGIYCLFAWKAGWTKAPANEKLCVVITKTYEIEDDEDMGEAPESNGWFANLFTPRAAESQAHVELPASESGNKKDAQSRFRFDSADVTVATDAERSRLDSAEAFPPTEISPPTTPDINYSKDAEEQAPGALKREHSNVDILEPLSEEKIVFPDFSDPSSHSSISSVDMTGEITAEPTYLSQNV